MWFSSRRTGVIHTENLFSDRNESEIITESIGLNCVFVYELNYLCAFWRAYVFASERV